MKYSEVKKQIVQGIVPYLKEFDFKIDKFDSSGFIIVNESDLNLLKVGFGKYDRPEGYEFAGGYEQIRFNKVEQIIFPLILKHRLWDTATEPTEMTTTFGNQSNDEKVQKFSAALSEIQVQDENTVSQYIERLKTYLENVSFPWFQKYSQLEAVNELINSLEMQDILNCFSAPFPTQFYRAMVITSSCNNKEKTLEIKEECLRRFKACETDDFYTKETVQSYYDSLDDLCRQLNV